MSRRWLLLPLCLVLFFSGCQSREGSAWIEENGKIKVLSTIAMIGDLVKQIGGEHIDATELIRGELDPHTYELVKGDDEKFARADLIFYNGLGLEHGLSLRKQLENNPRAKAVSEGINPAQILVIDGQYDPHVWMDIALWEQTIDPIVVALSEKDPQHAAEFRQNAEILREKMCDANHYIETIFQQIASEKRYLVTSHDAFNYFTRHYLADPGEENWEQRCMAPEGLAPDAQMSIADVLGVLAHIECFSVAVLFPESNVNQDALKKILDAGKKRGHPLRLCTAPLYADSMGQTGSYIEMQLHNVEVIAKELGGERR